MGAYFLKKQARSPILEGFGRNIYALLSFSGQQYFPMQGTLVHAFDLPAAKKRRSVQLTVTDRCGNTARWEGTFWR